jgi:hypothetical protein
MELKIEELDTDLCGNYYNENMYNEIPENVPVKVIKKNNTVQFTNVNVNVNVNNSKNSINTNNNYVNNSNSINYANYTNKSVDKKMVRPYVPEPKPKISYDDILKKMGMFVANGQLHLLDNQPKQIQEQINQQYINSKNNGNNSNINYIKKTYPQERKPPLQNQPPINVDQQNSYIYNKYFSEEIRDTPNVRVPKNLIEYRNMLIQDIVQKQRIKQVKSTKLIMPNSNINIAPNSTRNINRLFSYSNR